MNFGKVFKYSFNLVISMAEFDKFAENYSDIHKKAVSLSGEDDLFFVELKIKLLK